MILRATGYRNGVRAGMRSAAALMLVAGLGACTAQYRNHGYTPSDADLSQIVVGVDTVDVNVLCPTDDTENVVGNQDN